MCRSGRMFAPTKVYRRWHRKINKTQKRQAVASCLAATASAPLVQARGHRLGETVKEVPIVVSDDIESISKTKDAVECLKSLGLEAELKKCMRSRPDLVKVKCVDVSTRGAAVLSSCTRPTTASFKLSETFLVLTSCALTGR